MDMSNHARLSIERSTAAHEGLMAWIMLPFAVLHRQRWSAPWPVAPVRAAATTDCRPTR